MSLKDSVLAKIDGICNAFGATVQEVIDILTEKLEGEKKPETKQKIPAKSEELTEEKEEIKEETKKK